jgi:hypothetical protein
MASAMRVLPEEFISSQVSARNFGPWYTKFLDAVFDDLRNWRMNSTLWDFCGNHAEF